MAAGISVSGGQVKTPVGDAPIIPLLLIGFGGYLLWFGVKYWRGSGPAVWPSYPVKAVLQGHGLPPPEPAPTAASQVAAYEQQYAAAQGTGGGGSASGQAVAADAARYVGRVKYVWGGANPQTGWDCSGLVNWVVGHDMSLDIPGLPRGQRFDDGPGNHGPDVASWIAWTGIQHVASPQAGDLVAWGPNAHMGICTDATHCVSAQDPALGTTHTLIAATHTGIPVYLRLRATVGAPNPGGRPQHIARLLLSRFGWGPGQFQALDNLWTRESHWQPDARNPSSGALGIAQALGHGGADTAGSLGNEYGAQYGLSAAQARAANSGNALQQIRWGFGYIRSRYGSPLRAWEHEQRSGWY